MKPSTSRPSTSRPLRRGSLTNLADVVAAWIDMVGSADWRGLSAPARRRG